MDLGSTEKHIGSVKISEQVLEKIAKLATLEVEGVYDVKVSSNGVKGIVAKTNLPKSVEVIVADGMCDIDVHIVVGYGYNISDVCKDVQKAVKESVQNMTEITVSKVNVVVSGVETKKV